MRTNAAAEDFNLEISEDLIAQPTPVPSSTVPLSFASILDPPLKLRTNQAECGGQLWPAGMVLAEYILWHKLEVELGAGSGLVGLAVALGLQQTTTGEPKNETEIQLTDGLPGLIPLLTQNIDLNFRETAIPAVKLSAECLSWGQPPLETLAQPNVILAADCAYLEETFPLFVKTLQNLMETDTVLWFCYKKRRKRDKDCIKLIGKVLDVKIVKGPWEGESVFLYEVRARAA